MRSRGRRSIAVEAPEAGRARRFAFVSLLAAACAVVLSSNRALAQDISAQRDPVTLRLSLDAGQLAASRVLVPEGTRAYVLGQRGASSGRVLAWYRASDGRLLAAMHVVQGPAHGPTQDGVAVHAGAAHQGKAPALMQIASRSDVPGWNASPRIGVQPQAGAEQAAAALLTYPGSSHAVVLVPSMDHKLLRAARFDVRTRDAAGQVQNELRGLPSSGGSPSVVVSGAVTKPGVPSSLEAVNNGPTWRVLDVQPQPPLRWTQPPASPRFLVPPGHPTPLGSVVSDKPGAFNLIYRDEPAVDAASGQAAPAPIVADRTGQASLQVVSPAPVVDAQVVPQGGSPAARGAVNAVPSASGSHQLSRVALAAAAGLYAVHLADREGRKHTTEVAIVPLQEDMLQRERDLVFIETVPSGGESWFENGKPCDCEKLAVAPAPGADKKPDVSVETSVGGGNDSVLTVKITAKWNAILLCTEGDGECDAGLALSASSSGWTVDNNTGTPLPGSESFTDAASPPNKPSKTITCKGPCGKETTTTVTTTYTIQVANGKLRGKAPDHFGGGGKIGGKASGGTVKLVLMPKDCAGAGWTMVLRLTGKGADLAIDWNNSDRDGDGTPDGRDKADDPTPKPVPKTKPGK